MDIKDVKKPLTYEEQLQKMISRGCVVDDIDEAISILKRINYYRLSAYFLPFKGTDDNYISGTNLHTVYRMHEFDRELSRILFSVIVSVELMLRSQIAYHHVHTYGELGYLESENFNKSHKHNKFLEALERNLTHNKNQLFVKHHYKHYGGKFPLWVIIELFSFGDLSYFYSDMKMSDRKSIAKQYDTTPKNMSSWLMCLTNLRNYTAHYSRLYNNKFAAIPTTPNNFPYTLNKSVFDYILVLKFLNYSNTNWNTSFCVQLEALIEKYQEYIQLVHLGFPDNWLELLKY